MRVLLPAVAVITAVLLTQLPALAGGPNPQVRPCGDASRDFVVNSRDALFTLQVEAGLLKEPAMSYSFVEDWLFYNANLDQDIDSLDSLLVLQYDGGLVAQLPNCYDV
jgi:hypothetical protein